MFSNELKELLPFEQQKQKVQKRHPDKFSGHMSSKSRDIFFAIWLVKLQPGLVWCSYVFRKCRYNVFRLQKKPH